MSDFRKGLIWTAVPIAVFSIVSSIGMISSARGPAYFMHEGIYTWGLVWLIAALLLLIGIVVAIAFVIAGKKELAAGIGAGIGIGIVSLGITCFANVSV